jgi:hypothetical protein
MVAAGVTDRLDAVVEWLEPAATSLAIGTPGLGGLIFFGPLRYHLSLGLTALGRFEEAEATIAAAVDHMAAIEATPQVTRLRWAEAQLVRARDGSVAARPVLADVRRRAEHDRMLGLVGAVDRLEASIGA